MFRFSGWTFVVATLALAAGVAAAQQVVPNALLTIDQNRSTVVDRIVGEWGDRLARSNAGLSPAQLRDILSGLRSDHLLAASLAGTLTGLRDVIANALTTTAPVKPSRVQAQALGDTNDDLVYTPVVPCRILDTRNGTVPPYNSVMVGGSAFPVAANLSNFAPQGGSATNCGLSASFSAVVVTFTVLNPNFDAFMAASNTSNFTILTQSVVMDFSANRGLANTATVPVDGTEKFYLGLPASVTTHVIADIAGYFKTPGGGYVTSVATGPGLTGGPITSTGTVGLATTQPLPTTACAGNQVPQWNGSAWTCATVTGGGTVTSVGTGSGLTGGPITTTGTVNLAATNLLPTTACGLNQIPKWTGSAWACGVDNNSGGTVTSVTAGAGLTGGTITTTGTLAVDPTSSTLTGSFFKQGGNAFGVNPTVLGTTDGNPLQINVAGAAALQIQSDATSPIYIAGSNVNTVTAGASGAAIGGGGAPGTTLLAFLCTGSNCSNRVTDAFGAISGGAGNQAGNGTGFQYFATVGGGFSNIASGAFATVAGGKSNIATGTFATVAGGVGNGATGNYATVAGGDSNSALGDYSFAAGYQANADQSHCLVFTGWSSLPGSRFSCRGITNVAKFGLDHGLSVDYHSLQTNGSGTRWVAISDLAPGQTISSWIGAYLSDAGVWVNASSSKTKKTDFATVDPREVLAKVAQLPITTWRYKEGEGEVHHMGPMAEDFWAAFKIGYGQSTIADLDARGVALAAIQGLNAKVDDQQREIAVLKEQVQKAETLAADVAALKAALAELQRERTTVAVK